MALEIGNLTATAGMTKAIYDQIRANIEPGLDDLGEEELVPIRDGWKKLAHGIATGVIEHLLSSLEIRDVETRGTVTVSLGGFTATANSHRHGAGTLEGSQTVTFQQINEGTGLIA